MNSNLVKFDGTGDPTAVSWLRLLDNSAKCANLDSLSANRLFVFHLDGEAKAWYYSLPSDIKKNHQALRAAFLERFQLQDDGFCISGVLGDTRTQGFSVLDIDSGCSPMDPVTAITKSPH